MSGFADRMCQCNDEPCALAVQEGMSLWSTEFAEESRANTRDGPKVDEDLMSRMTEQGMRYSECMIKAMAAP